MTYFVGDWYSDSAIMFSILDDLELSTGNDRRGTKFFIKKTPRATRKPSDINRLQQTPSLDLGSASIHISG